MGTVVSTENIIIWCSHYHWGNQNMLGKGNKNHTIAVLSDKWDKRCTYKPDCLGHAKKSSLKNKNLF